MSHLGLAPLGVSYGYLIRLLLLLRWREYGRVVDECSAAFYPMTFIGGTFWEHKSKLCMVDNLPGYCTCSLIQGCTSMVGAAVLRAVMGLQKIDNEHMMVTLDFSSVPIHHGRLKMQTEYGPILIEREYEGDGPFVVRYSVPDACKVELIPPMGPFHIHASYGG
jgi:hypothetical protein